MEPQRRTKIVCTLGPATQSPEAVAGLVAAGMDVARLNFSHGSRDEHAAIYGRVREASDASGRAVGILVDLQGPKIRLGTFDGGFAVLETGSVFTVTARGPHGPLEALTGTSTRASTSYGALATDLGPGDTLLIDKDADDLRFALGLGVDIVALSFVRRPEDADVVRRAMDAAGRRIPVIAKLEKGEAVEHLDGIMEAFDGVMVARGDLGVETPMEQVPLVQKRAVTLARQHAKPAIVATQMLESMRVHSRPTRAEVSDVANAVLDGADALMLSAETSVGEHAIEAVATMARIITSVEDGGWAEYPSAVHQLATPEEALAMAAPQLAQVIGARALVAFTQSGATARRLAAQRPPIPVLAVTPEAAVRSRLALTWGVETFVAPLAGHLDEMVTQAARTVLDCGRIRWGDAVVIVAGSLQGRTGATDMIRVLHLDSPADFDERLPA